MIYKSLRLLITTILISSVNFNTPYCMEDKTELQTEAELKTMRVKCVDLTCDLLNRFNTRNGCCKYTKSKVEEMQQELIETVTNFGLYLFGNNGNNLRNMFSPKMQAQLQLVASIFKNLQSDYTIVTNKDYLYFDTLDKAERILIDILKSDKSLCNRISYIVTNIDIKEKNFKNIEDFNNVIDNIKRIVLIASLGMDTSFMKIDEDYRYRIYDETTTDQQLQFFNGLFGNNCDNLITVLSCDITQELYYIKHLLEYCGIAKYIIDKLKNNNLLLETVRKIVDNIENNGVQDNVLMIERYKQDIISTINTYISIATDKSIIL